MQKSPHGWLINDYFRCFDITSLLTSNGLRGLIKMKSWFIGPFFLLGNFQIKLHGS